MRKEGELEIVCDPFYRFYLEARGGSGDYIRSWHSGSKFTQTVVQQLILARRISRREKSFRH